MYVTAIMLPNAESAIAIFMARLPPNTFKFEVSHDVPQQTIENCAFMLLILFAISIVGPRLAVSSVALA